MRYTQKDIYQAFGIKRETLRHYERLGIITPEIAPNGYRFYDDWQINLLWDAKRYQAMGFTLAQIRDILHRDGLSDVQELVVARKEEMERELAYRNMALEEMRLFQQRLAEIEMRIDTYDVIELPEARFIPRREVHDLLFDERLDESTRFAIENQAVCMPPCAFLPDAYGKTYYWGFAMRTDRYERLGGPESGFVTLPAGRALVTCVDAGERWSFGQTLFTNLLEEANRRDERPRGMLWGLLLSRTHDEMGGYHRYVEALLPLEDN